MLVWYLTQMSHCYTNRAAKFSFCLIVDTIMYGNVYARVDVSFIFSYYKYNHKTVKHYLFLFKIIYFAKKRYLLISKLL